MNIEHIDMFAGEDRTITLHARDASNYLVNLTGKTVQWFVGPRCFAEQGSVFTKSGTITSAGSGFFTVTVLAADTINLEGDYQHMAKTTSGAGLVAVVCQGRFRVRPSLVT